MTVLEIYAFFVLPVLVLAIGLGAYWLNRPPRQERHSDQTAKHM